MNLEEEIITTKAGSKKLGIKTGLTQEEFNKAIISYLESVNFTTTSTPGRTISTAADLTTTAGKNVVKTLNFTPSLGDVQVEMKDASIDVTYDIRNMLASIPAGAEIRKTTIRLDGTKQVVANTSKNTQTISVAPSEFPLSLDVEVRADSSEGSFILHGYKTIHAENMVSTVEFNKEFTSAKSIETQEDLNIKILEDINTLKRMLTK